MDYEEGPTACIWIRGDTSPALIAHEAYHATTMLVEAMQIDPNDYSVVRPKADDPDFGYQPAELAAHLLQAIVEEALIQQRVFCEANR